MLVVLAALLAGCGPAEDRAPGPVPTQTQASASAYARCLADLRAEHTRWVADPAREHNPSSCDQPGVPYADYARAFAEAGGPVWVADEQSSGRP